MENSVELSKKTENRTTIQPRNFSLEYLFEKVKTQTVILRCMHPSVHSSIIAKIWKKLKCLAIDEWIRTMLYLSIVEYYSAIKNE